MENQIPAYIMLPSNGEKVLCWGFDAEKKPFTRVVGQKVNGQWQRPDPNIILGTVVSWRLLDSTMRRIFAAPEP